MRVRIMISPRAAILARSASTGVIEVKITDEDLAEAQEDALLELAQVVESDEVVEVDVGSATPEAVLQAMRARADARARDTDAAERLAAAEAAERESTSALDRAMHEVRQGALKNWVLEHGSDDQRARMSESLLSEQEILDDVLDDLIQIDEDEYTPLKKEQACDCERGCAGAVQFSVGPPGSAGLDMRQYAALQRVREQAPPSSRVTVRLHQASCPECYCAPLQRFSALVTVEWEGWRLVKEYALR